MAAIRVHQRLAPHLRDEDAQVVGHVHRGERRLQLHHVALLHPQLRLLRLQHFGRGVGLRVVFGLVGDEGFERTQLGRIELELIEIALDDFLHQLAHAVEQLLAGPVVEIVERARERAEPVDEAAHRMLARREEGRVAERDAQHWQLQPRDLARHLRRHARVGQDLIEQASDHVDHHVIELAGRRLQQLFAVGANQVHCHQPLQAFAVTHAARGRTASGAEPARRTLQTHRAAAAAAAGCAVGGGGLTSDRRIENAGPAGEEGQAAQQVHQVRVGFGDCAAARVGGAATRSATATTTAATTAATTEKRCGLGRRVVASRADVATGMTAVKVRARRAGEITRLSSRRLQRVAHARVARLIAGQGVAGTFDGLHREADGVDIAALQVLNDRRVALGHRLAHRVTHLARQQLASFGIGSHGQQAAADRAAEHVCAQRVALLVGAADAEYSAHVGRHLAKFPFAGVRDLLADAVGQHALIELMVFHERQRLPVGGDLLAP